MNIAWGSFNDSQAFEASQPNTKRGLFSFTSPVAIINISLMSFSVEDVARQMLRNLPLLFLEEYNLDNGYRP